MNALVYKNTKTTLPRWVSTLHERCPRGIAHETATHFVHFYGDDFGLWTISHGLTVTEQKQGTLQDWVVKTFGAQDVTKSTNAVGHTVAGAWRPGIFIYDDIRQGLGTIDSERHEHLQSIRLLLGRLDELLLYIEPSIDGLKTYSHKIRELLILACTEVESNWKRYLKAAGVTPLGRDFTTNDYVKLNAKLFLSEFEISIKPYPSIPPIRPFDGWSPAQPTQSLRWYNAYNLTKHDRQSNFAQGTLEHCLSAVCANIVLFSVCFSPFPLFQEGGSVSALCNQFFEIDLRGCSPTTFYIRAIDLPPGSNTNLICFDCVQNKVSQPWVVDPFVL